MLSTPEPNLESESGDIVFSHFQCQATEAVRHMITSGKNKSYIFMFRLLLSITNMVSLSLQTGYFAETLKTAVVYPSLKKTGLDLLFKNFRLISKFQFVSKLTECVLASQIQFHMITNNLFPQLQSTYRSHHSPEPALLKATNDLLMNMDKGHVSLLLLLDLSAAFNTVDHGILLQSLQKKLSVCVTALFWFKSYLEGRSQRICINETLSQPFEVSCLGPLLFTIYTQDLFSKCLWSI